MSEIIRPVVTPFSPCVPPFAETCDSELAIMVSVLSLFMSQLFFVRCSIEYVVGTRSILDQFMYLSRLFIFSQEYFFISF